MGVRFADFIYCKFGNFREKFIFTKSVKRPFCDAKISRLMHNLPLSVNDRVITSFRDDIIFTKIREYKTLAKMSDFAVIFLKYPIKMK